MRDDKRTWSATELIRLLGTGSYGSVYQGVCEGEKVAVKVLQLVAGSEADINNELRQLRGCDHENIIAYRDAFVGKTQQVIAQPATRLAPAPKALWVVMEYCEAGSCLDVMRERGRGFDEPCVAHISCCVLRGLDYLHTQRKVIHRDIKAANVLLNARGEVKLADLGIVAQLQNTMSKRGTMIGTPHWMAPEALSHAAGICEGGYGTAVDVWSLGITVIELSERDPPFFDASSVYGAMLRIVQGPPAKLGPQTAGSRRMRDFIAAALVKDPAQRPDASALLSHPFVQQSTGCELSATVRALLAGRRQEGDEAEAVVPPMSLDLVELEENLRPAREAEDKAELEAAACLASTLLVPGSADAASGKGSEELRTLHLQPVGQGAAQGAGRARSLSSPYNTGGSVSREASPEDEKGPGVPWALQLPPSPESDQTRRRSRGYSEGARVVSRAITPRAGTPRAAGAPAAAAAAEADAKEPLDDLLSLAASWAVQLRDLWNRNVECYQFPVPPEPKVPRGYLVFAEQNGGCFELRWSVDKPEGALAAFTPSQPVPAFKLTNNGGRSELCRAVGGPNVKKFYRGWLQYIKLAAQSGARLAFHSNVAKQPVAIYVMLRGDSTIVPLKVGGEAVPLGGVFAVAVVGARNDGLRGVRQLEPQVFLSIGDKIGASMPLGER